MRNNEFFFGLDEVSCQLNSGCDKSLKDEYIAHFAKSLKCKTVRIWLNTKEMIKIAENDKIEFVAEGLINFHNYLSTLRRAGVERFLLLDWGFVYPYGYHATDKWVVPDPKREPEMYKRFMLLQQKIKFEIASNFSLVEYFESTNEPDGEGGAFLHKNGYHMDGKNNKDYIFTRDEIENIILDLNYFENLGIKAANKNAKMLIPSFCNLDYTPQYLDDIYTKIESGKYPTIGEFKSKKIEDFFEILNWHPYNMISVQINDDWIKSQERIREVILKHKDGDRKVWYTEMGWSDFRREDEKIDIGKRHVDFINYVSENMPWVETIFFFRLFDLANRPESEEQDYFGLVYNEHDWYAPLSPKPAMVAIYKRINGESASIEPLYKYANSKDRELYPSIKIDDGDYKVLILGNHIAYQKQAPWNNYFESKGMDASKKEFDFVHLLHKQLKAKHPSIETTVIDMRNWEGCFYWDQMYNELNKFKDKEYDLVVVRLGDNIGQFSFNDHVYKDHLLKLCNFFKSDKTKFIITSTLENKKHVDEHQKLVAEALNCPFVDLENIRTNYSNLSNCKYLNNEHRLCPNDLGMEQISKSILSKLDF